MRQLQAPVKNAGEKVRLSGSVEFYYSSVSEPAISGNYLIAVVIGQCYYTACLALPNWPDSKVG